MTMLKAVLKDRKNQEIRELGLTEKVFGYPLRIPLIHEAVHHFTARNRRGTASTKTRNEVRGGGKKPWKQKKTGRARVGSIRSPIWRGGGTIFGPQPRSYDYRFPKKKARNAVRSVLSEKLREGNLIVVDDLSLEEPKTRLLVALLEGMELRRKTLIVDGKENSNLFLAARNHPRVKAMNASEINVYDLLDFEVLLISEAALGRVTEAFLP